MKTTAILDLVVLSGLISLPFGNAWVLDKSCKSTISGTETNVRASIASALDLARKARTELKKDQVNGKVTQLYHNLFNEASDPVAVDKNSGEYKNVISVLNEIQGFEAESNDKSKVDDVVIYCDFSRFVENKEAKTARDPDTGMDVSMDDTYNGCKASTFSKDTTLAYTLSNNARGNKADPNYKIAQVQLCGWYIGEMNQVKYKIWGTINPKSIISRAYSRWEQLRKKTTAMDAAALFDHTILHEFTHAVKSNPTDDVGGSDKAYGWDNCRKLGGSKGGWHNADSVAFFALGNDMIVNSKLTNAYLNPNADGSVSKMTGSPTKRLVAAMRRAIRG